MEIEKFVFFNCNMLKCIVVVVISVFCGVDGILYLK